MTVDLVAFYKFLLLFLRASFLVFFVPVVGSRSVPAFAKAGLALFLAYVAYVGRSVEVVFPETVVGLVLEVMRELLFGALVGFVARLVFDGIQLGGQYVGYMMGFSVVNVMDPQAETAMPLISHVENILAVLIFLVIGGHLWFMSAFFDSLKLFPLGKLSLSVKWSLYAVKLVGGIFVIAIKVNAPVFLVLFLIQLVMAVVARVIPQMNIFMVGFPVQIFVGMVLLMFSLQGMLWLFGREFSAMRLHIYEVMRILR